MGRRGARRRISAVIPEEQFARLEDMADAEGETIARIVERIIRRALARWRAADADREAPPTDGDEREQSDD